MHRASDECDGVGRDAAPRKQVIHDFRIGPRLFVGLLFLRPSAEFDHGGPGIGECQQDLFSVRPLDWHA